MLVGDQNAIELFRRAPNAQQALPDLPPAQARIH
jgi:hypothetical protein